MEMSSLEVSVAYEIAKWRRMSAWKDGYTDGGGMNYDFNSDVLGALGEMAVGKELNIYYEPTNRTFKDADLGDMEIKTVRYSSYGHAHECFPVELSTDDSRRMVCVVGSVYTREFEVKGWISAKEAKTIEPKKVLYRPAHWFSFSKLKKMSEVS